MANYFVTATQPDDSGNGLTHATAKKTLDAIVAVMSTGVDSTLNLDGTFMDQDLVGLPNGTSGHELLIQRYSAGITANITNGGIVLTSNSYIRIMDVVIDNTSYPEANAIAMSNCANIEIELSTFTAGGADNGIIFLSWDLGPNTDINIHNNLLRNTNGYGIYLSQANDDPDNITCENNTYTSVTLGDTYNYTFFGSGGGAPSGAPTTGTVVKSKALSFVGSIATLSGTNPAGVNRGLVVDVEIYYASGAVASPDSVKFNAGSPMTVLKTVETITDYVRQIRYFMVAPATGAHNIVVDCTTGGVPDSLFVVATPLEGLNQSNPYNTSVSDLWDQVTLGTSFSVTDTHSATGELELDFALGIRGLANPFVSPNAGQTELANQDDLYFAQGVSSRSGATNRVMGWTVSSDGLNGAWGIISTAFNPVTAATLPTLTQVTPASGAPSTAPTLTIRGTDLDVQYSGGDAILHITGGGVILGTPTIVNSTTITVIATIAAGQVGLRLITVETDGGVSNSLEFGISGEGSWPMIRRRRF